jgi:hypothetical protein
MLDTLSDREDIFIAGSEKIVDHDAALDFQAGFASERGIWANSDRHYDKIGRQGAAIFEPHRLNFAMAENRRRICACQNLYIAFFNRLPQ